MTKLIFKHHRGKFLPAVRRVTTACGTDISKGSIKPCSNILEIHVDSLLEILTERSMTSAQGHAIKIAFGKPFKVLISSSCGIWKPNFVLVRQINCINLQNGGKCHLSSFKSAASEKVALTSVTAPLPHISTERCHGRPDLQILITT